MTEPGCHAMFVVEVDDTPMGMAFGLIDREVPSRTHLGGMWVDPKGRHRGCGRALADAVIGWTQERGFSAVGPHNEPGHPGNGAVAVSATVRRL